MANNWGETGKVVPGRGSNESLAARLGGSAAAWANSALAKMQYDYQQKAQMKMKEMELAAEMAREKMHMQMYGDIQRENTAATIAGEMERARLGQETEINKVALGNVADMMKQAALYGPGNPMPKFLREYFLNLPPNLANTMGIATLQEKARQHDVMVKNLMSGNFDAVGISTDPKEGEKQLRTILQNEGIPVNQQGDLILKFKQRSKKPGDENGLLGAASKGMGQSLVSSPWMNVAIPIMSGTTAGMGGPGAIGGLLQSTLGNIPIGGQSMNQRMQNMFLSQMNPAQNESNVSPEVLKYMAELANRSKPQFQL